MLYFPFMSFLADIHIHSKYSRATSKECHLEGLHKWAQLKGVRVVGCGDFTHPEWFDELQRKLTPTDNGLFRLRDEFAAPMNSGIPEACRAEVFFILTGEISSIYKRDGRCRKVHSLLLAPDLETVVRINTQLDALGNIKSDGRPILSLDPRNLLEIALEAHAKTCLVPAHIWTPWFSMLGSKSGFDSLEACFGDLAKHIFAVETGLSSDPPMNWRVSLLDNCTLISNSDLHSPANLGRNANIFHCEPAFDTMINALRTRNSAHFGGTIDLYPEEGKYHFDGHRKCNVCMEPEESLAHDNLCPVCRKPLVLGVLHRVVELADRPKGGKPDHVPGHEYIIPLPELLSEIYGVGAQSKKVQNAYQRLLAKFGPEFTMLREIEPDLLDRDDCFLLGEAVRRVRARRVIRQAGYDGEYGVIHAFEDQEIERLKRQHVAFDADAAKRSAKRKKKTLHNHESPDHRPLSEPATDELAQMVLFSKYDQLAGLDPSQRSAAMIVDRPLLILGAPGTGKTLTLMHRIAYLTANLDVQPQTILALAASHRAVAWMRTQLPRKCRTLADPVFVETYPSLCLKMLRRFHDRMGLPAHFVLIDQNEAAVLLQKYKRISFREACARIDAIDQARNAGNDPFDLPGYQELTEMLIQEGKLELNALIPEALHLLENEPEAAAAFDFAHICVDEYHNLNRVQAQLIRCLAPHGQGLCATADPNQAIFDDRGGDANYTLRFTRDFPQATSVELSCDHRSTGHILQLTSTVSTPERANRAPKARCLAEKGARVRIYQAASVAAEARYIAQEIKRLLGRRTPTQNDTERQDTSPATGYALRDIAILVRFRQQMEPLRKALARMDLPVRAVGDLSFLAMPGAARALDEIRRSCVNRWHDPAGEALKGFAMPSDIGPEARDALSHCLRLGAGTTRGLGDFIDDMALRREVDDYDPTAPVVTILTYRTVRGLEFPVVFVAGCEEGIIPYIPAEGKPPKRDGERRLLYVALSRARKVLYITASRRRTLFGVTRKARLSPFLHDIDRQCLIRQKRASRIHTVTRQLEFKM